eukprot:CAMPEP_0194371302 /NCGR_PEP_ID=MMETSP0174-20130528/19694_1 /TAXON_ID=216777 /ORGANISM="Proboscia alata, Strain PI-D3" /LENGTH=222 /DNA_ID=CAMNT_0039149275 /DNA_START=347 /DNA_END=1012 /DNA_ORIENTATION=-
MLRTFDTFNISLLDQSLFAPNSNVTGGGIPGISHIVNVGFPKCGSTSLYSFFQGAYGVNASKHQICGAKEGVCGICMKKAVNKNLPPLTTCGNHTKSINQMDYDKPKCVFPQMSYLQEIYDDDPTVTFILPFRPVKDWIKSVTKWNDMRQRLTKCNLPGLPSGRGKKDNELVYWYGQHVQNIRKFVDNHPGMALVEFSIYNPLAGKYLERVFPDKLVKAKYW